MAEAVEKEYPNVRFFFNPDWANTGPAKSLSIAALAAGAETFICYSDVLFRAATVVRLSQSEADITLVVDSSWQHRYEGRSAADLAGAEKVRVDAVRGTVSEIGKQIPVDDASAEFVGLLRLSSEAANHLRQVVKSGRVSDKAGLPTIVTALLRGGYSSTVVDVCGDWAELNAPQDLARFVLGTKAESLERLRAMVRVGKINEQVAFSLARWNESRQAVLDDICAAFGQQELIVRSSAHSEDTWLHSSAGAYTSVLDVPGDSTETLTAAIEEVFASYNGDPQADDQVLVQAMLRDVRSSGVLMTRTSTLAAPYYVINFDTETGSTDSVTSGEGTALRTVFLHRTDELRRDLPEDLEKVVEASRELERLVGHDSLDIEFAVTADGTAHILQVRPIAVQRREQPVDDARIAQGLEIAREYFRGQQRSVPHCVGGSTQYSVMADWNPAEMIGVKPKRLAFSLYRHLITDESWARQRAEYGYRDVRPCNLIVDFLGHPYIDVRVDFNSFIPASVPDELATRLVDYYLARLEAHPELHDKVEFDILHTCFSFDLERRLEELRAAGFSADDNSTLAQGLLEVTRGGIERCSHGLAPIERMSARYEEILGRGGTPLERAFLLLEDVRRIGVPEFSHLARHAFIATTLIRSLVDAGLTTVEQREAFLASLRTVPSAMQEDALRVRAGDLGWDEFVAIYGHLRPGSYDITSPCYGSAPEDFLRPMLESAQKREDAAGSTFAWPSEQRDAVDRILEDHSLGVDAEGLDRFLRTAIEGREFGKFIFMRNVNAALESLAEFGAAHGLTREDLAHIPIADFYALRGPVCDDVERELHRLSLAGKEAFFTTHATSLPAQILTEEDLVCFEQRRAEPNFVTRKTVRADVVVLADSISPEIDLAGKIVVVPNADPGFDWLFSRDIAGLITMYGGVNSHMAVRAAEFQLPAAIGSGEILFDTVRCAELIELDCASRQIKVIR